MSALWNLDQLKSELSRRREVKSWQIHQESVQRRERYFLLDAGRLAVDQDRAVDAQTIAAKIAVNLPGKPTRQGEAQKKLFPALPLAPQLDAAIAAALETDLQAWDLPATPPADLPVLKTADPRIQEDMDRSLTTLTQEISLSAEASRLSKFNSAELFLSLHDHEMHLSNGTTHRSSQSRIYAEAAFSFSRKGADGKPESDEYLSTRWAVNQDDLKIGKLFDEAAERAEKSLDVRRPRGGNYALLIDVEVLAPVLCEYANQLTAVHSYNGLPFVAPGKDLIPGAEGDLLTLTLDPTLAYGADTAAVSDQGSLQKQLRLVERNRVVATSTDKQYSDYGSGPITTVRGDLVVEPGKFTHAELTRAEPLVLEILQFSGLFVDRNSGTFSSEIRLARLYDRERGTVETIKGGSVSGSVRENFRKVRLSSETTRRAHFGYHGEAQGYFGPEYALLSDVSVAGD